MKESRIKKYKNRSENIPGYIHQFSPIFFLIIRQLKKTKPQIYS